MAPGGNCCGYVIPGAGPGVAPCLEGRPCCWCAWLGAGPGVAPCLEGRSCCGYVPQAVAPGLEGREEDYCMKGLAKPVVVSFLRGGGGGGGGHLGTIDRFSWTLPESNCRLNNFVTSQLTLSGLGTRHKFNYQLRSHF